MTLVTVLGGKATGLSPAGKRRAERLLARVERADRILASLDPKALRRLAASLPSGRRKADALLGHIEESRRNLSSLDPTTCAELVRRDEETAEIDGYPARSPGSSVGGGGGPSIEVAVGGVTETLTLTSSTEGAVFARANGPRADPIGDAVRRIEMDVHVVELVTAALVRVPASFAT